MLLIKYMFNFIKNTVKGIFKLVVNAYRVLLGTLVVLVSLPFAWAINYDVVGERIHKYAIGTALGVSMTISVLGIFFVQHFSDLDWAMNWTMFNILLFGIQTYLEAGNLKSFLNSLID